MNYIISYDVGTTGLKTCLFSIDQDICLIESALEDYKLTVLDNGGIEQNPEDWYQAMIKTTHTILERSNIDKRDIKGISFCAQMQGVVLVDQQGTALRPAMSYMDNRGVNEHKEGLIHGIKISGMNARKLLLSIVKTGAVSASIKDPLWKYKWVEKNEPELFKKIYKWLDIKEYLILRLTGKFIMTEDSAFATLLYDSKKKQFSKSVCKLFGVNINHLPEIIKSTDTVGELTKNAAEALKLDKTTTVFGGGGDASLVSIGSGAVSINDTHIYMGTSGWVSTIVDRRLLDITHMIASIQGAQKNKYNYFAELETAGKCLEWVRDHLALDEIGVYLKKHPNLKSTEEVSFSLYNFMMEAIKDVPAGSNGVIFTPWLHGNRNPFEDHYARGMFFNISLETGKRDMIHAVLEGICYHLKWQLEASEKKASTSKTIRFVGGGSLSELTSQILADILNRKIETVEYPQNIGSVGAAIVAGVGLGYLDNLEQAKELVKVNRTFIPNKEHLETYNEGYKVFKSLYFNNKKSFKKLNEKES